MNVLVTGFDPFGGEPVNPALEAVKKLEGLTIAGATIHTKEIPTVRFKSIEAVKAGIAEFDPEIVLCVGQAGGRTDITVERIGMNVDDFRIPDNEGNQVIDEPIVEGAPTGYFATLPIKKIVAALRAAGIPASVSNTAGSFVCNHVLYGLMHALAVEGNKRRGGFIHIPYLPEQAARIPGQPSMAVETVVAGLKIALETAITTLNDVKETGGTICRISVYIRRSGE